MSEVESRTQNQHNQSIFDVGPSVMVEMPRFAIEALNLDVKHWNLQKSYPKSAVDRLSDRQDLRRHAQRRRKLVSMYRQEFPECVHSITLRND